MKKNMGRMDRTIRTVIALVIGILFLTETISGTLGAVLGVIAVVFLATSLVGWCPAYIPFRISTCKPEAPAGE